MTRTPSSLKDCVEIALSKLDPTVRETFADDPFDALTNGLNLKVGAVRHLSQSRSDGGSCDGMSFLDDGVILYAPTDNRRENFTLAHELGHWLIDQADHIYDWLSTQPEPMVVLETVCDRVAQRLLLPEATIRAVIGTGPVEARQVIDLYNASRASVPACGIALATQLPTLGAVIIIDRATHVIEYASVHPHPDHGWPQVHPWRHHEVPAGHPLKNLETDGTLRRRSTWTNKWDRTAEYYIDAVAGPRRTIAVLADIDLWQTEAFHPTTTREYRNQVERQVTCCGRTYTVRTYPCPKCRQPFCPACKGCRCDRQAAAETRCAGPCGLNYLPHLLEGGLCDECR